MSMYKRELFARLTVPSHIYLQSFKLFCQRRTTLPRSKCDCDRLLVSIVLSLRFMLQFSFAVLPPIDVRKNTSG